MSDENPIPFGRTEEGLYQVVQPVDGLVPDTITVEVNDVTYRLSEYVGKDTQSKQFPDVLLYKFLAIDDENGYERPHDPTTYGVTD